MMRAGSSVAMWPLRPSRGRSSGRARGRFRLGLALLAAAFASLENAGAGSERAGSKRGPGDRPLNPQDLQVVDCLLPGQVRKLGRQTTYVTQRRPVRTTALDCEIRGGEYVAYDRANYATALRIWLDAAEAGDAQALYYVGEIYERGLGAEPDYAKAAEWYRKAAEKGFTQAKVNLGFLYEKGLGVPQDTRAALEWYRQASGVSEGILLDSEVATIRQELADATARLKEAEEESAALETQLAAARTELATARSAGKKSTEETAALERRLAVLEQQSGANRQQVAQLNQARQKYAMAGPTIEIIDPSAVRSASPTPPKDAGERGGLVGRVEAPAGLDRLLANGKTLAVDGSGFFRVSPGAERRFTFVAIDAQGKRGELIWDLDAPGGAASGKGAGGKRAMPPPAKAGTYHALLIGNGEYRSLPRLATAVNDATALGDLLKKRYGFRVTLLQNASYLDILGAFSTLREDLAEKDNLLIYYAGHGELDPASGLGYWLPVDAEQRDKTNWMSSREVSLQLSLLPPRHVLLIADSCYSGAMTRSSLARFEGLTDKERDEWMRDVAARRSRTALTSGGLKPVLDTGGGGHSIFARAVLDTLTRGSGTVETYQLWAAVKARVMLETRALREQQVPEYAPIQYAGHESGEFFFVPVRE